MRQLIRIVAIIVISSLTAPAFAADLADGQPAPEFKLQDQTGKWHTLADHRGQWLVMYFYPKDDTPGCTAQACLFRDHVFKIRAAGAEVLGVSLDDVGSHKAFAEKYQLPFPLLADVTHDTARAYGVLTKHGDTEYAKRETFVIDPQGKVAKHYIGVDPKKNATEVLADLQTLQADRAVR
jgi:peroxiredoxin Q/BCP